ncbi:SDR family NAD(P)-dependent oxidoreductase [Mesorhizobium sp. WSM4976]|uniref:SDR family NAD(P)-dependent oxidoreductase n=1 Tax=Mesorhizobium sp. WSM4976 TaxID=3038549 RepID=UPI0024163659|nr:SDR family oxidoreductase [Mesorhizobium sp. WSM4976]MDG4898568.1 SDR family NAD(P)-dependent oxidoreductase [Mesorhizobium sp. WSM4976]
MSYLNLPPLDFASQRLKDKVIFVTGASSGIGAAAVRLFAREGAQVVAAARRRQKLEALSRELEQQGFSVACVECDVRGEASVSEAIDFTVARYGRLDGAFNNAGVHAPRLPIHEARVEDLDAVLTTNLRGVFLCLKHETAAMLKSGGGAIVNTSSIAGLIGAPGNSMYAASKWGLSALTRCVALDYARSGIRVNAIAPGPTRSEMFDDWQTTEDDRARLADKFPMNYIAHPDDMARAALFLLSDEARWTTGITLPCEGGRSVA